MSEVTVRFRGDTRQLERSLANVNRGLDRVERNAKQSNRALRSISATGDRVTGVLRAAGAALVAFGTTRAVQGILGATEAMEGFRTQLTTYLGSQELANAELARLSKLARTLPQDVNELTEAFVIFNRFGLDTSNESMKAFSNIAAANSKSITQLGEAVADALTGEFERLKEFGVKVSKENGKFTARIGEDQVAVATSTKDLVEQLKALGAEGGRFGNVTIGPLTLAMSNFRGAVFEASAALGEGGFGLAVADAVNAITDMLTKNDELIDAIGDGLTKAFLYAKEVAILLYQNIEILGKIMAVVIGIGMARWAIGVGTAMAGLAVVVGGGLVKAFGFLGKVLRATALLALRHPIIGGIMAVIGGIEYFTGAVSGLAEKLGLIGEDSALDNLVEQGQEFAKTITGPVVKGLEDAANVSARVEEQFAGIKARTVETNKALSETEAKAKTIEKAKQAELQAEEDRAEQVQKIIEQKYEELRISQLTKQEQETIKLIKEAELKLGKKLEESEKSQLRELVKQTREIEKQKALRDAFRPESTFETQVAAGGSAFRRLNPAMVYQQEYEEALKGIEIARREGEISEREYLRTLLRLNREHGNKMHDLKKEQAAEQLKLAGVTNQEITDAVMTQMDAVRMMQQGGVQAAQGALSSLGQIFGAMAGQSRAAFEAYKKVQIAQALISTYSAAAKAIAFPPGPPISLLYVAGAIAAGMAQVNAIRSQTYQGRQLGGPVAQGQTYMVGETGPELFTPSTSGRIDRMDSFGKTPVEITFNINAVDAAGVDELLIDRKGTIQQIISDAMLERGQRSGF
jgi:hypothetical protein